MSNYNFFKINDQNLTRTITINRPEIYNALNKDAKFELIEAINSAQGLDEIRSIIITGEGKAFCTGQDLNDRSIQKTSTPIDLGKTLETEWNPLVSSIRNSKVPVIALVNGVVAGAGLSIVIACDFIISMPKVKYLSGFSKLGLCADAGSTYTLTKALGLYKAKEFFLLGEALLAEDLLESKIVYKITDNLLDAGKILTTTLNSLAPLAVEKTKVNINMAQENSFEIMLETEKNAQRLLGNSLDYQEGLQAFFEKRTAQFKGK